MKLLYKGQRPTKAHTNDVGFDLHPITLTIVFYNGRRVKIENLQNKLTSELEIEIASAIEQHGQKHFWSNVSGIKKLIFDTGTAVTPPKNMWTMLCPNSRLCKTSGLVMQNSIGVVDPGYTGNIKATYILTENTYSLDDILMLCHTCGQLILMPLILPELVECDKLDETERGEKGFGSSGKK